MKLPSNPPPGRPEAAMERVEKQLPDEAMMRREEPTDAVVKNDETESAKLKQEPEQAAPPSHVYAAFAPAMLTDGVPKVLFFHAAWCPKCVQQDKVLEGWYPSADFAYSTYKIDYDSAAELKQRYGVVQQHTYVTVDGQGNKISAVSFPGDDELKALLQTK